MLDMEASLEHMRRGTVRHVDTLLIVTEPYFRSLETAARLAQLAAELEIPRVAAVANQVRSPGEEAAIRDFCAHHGLEVVATVPFDPEVTRADNLGLALLDAAPDCPAADILRELAANLDGMAAAVGLEA
ncbi:MAG: ATP-binding protein [Candidatus Dormibacteria bacterium]